MKVRGCTLACARHRLPPPPPLLFVALCHRAPHFPPCQMSGHSRLLLTVNVACAAPRGTRTQLGAPAPRLAARACSSRHDGARCGPRAATGSRTCPSFCLRVFFCRVVSSFFLVAAAAATAAAAAAAAAATAPPPAGAAAASGACDAAPSAGALSVSLMIFSSSSACCFALLASRNDVPTCKHANEVQVRWALQRIFSVAADGQAGDQLTDDMAAKGSRSFRFFSAGSGRAGFSSAFSSLAAPAARSSPLSSPSSSSSSLSARATGAGGRGVAFAVSSPSLSL